MSKRRDVTLGKARELINGDRAKDYGDAADNFQRIADLWSPIFGHEVTPAQVALCLMQLKVSRLITSPDHEDSWVDAAGYVALGSEVAGVPGEISIDIQADTGPLVEAMKQAAGVEPEPIHKLIRRKSSTEFQRAVVREQREKHQDEQNLGTLVSSAANLCVALDIPQDREEDVADWLIGPSPSRLFGYRR